MKPYRPSNVTEVLMFSEQFCDCCHHWQGSDEDPIGCPISNATPTLFANPGDAEYPSQWVEDDDGKNPRCLAHHPRAARKEVETVLPLSPEEAEWLRKQMAKT